MKSFCRGLIADRDSQSFVVERRLHLQPAQVIDVPTRACVDMPGSTWGRDAATNTAPDNEGPCADVDPPSDSLPPLSSAPSPAPGPWAIFNRATSTAASSSRRRVPGKIEPRERVHDKAPEDLSGRVHCERYALTRRLGNGGMGEVYEARFLAGGQSVAVKLLFARFADEPELMTRCRHTTSCRCSRRACSRGSFASATSTRRRTGGPSW